MHERNLGEPHELQRVVEVAGGLGLDVAEDLGDAGELGGALGRSGGGQLARGRSIAADIGHHRLERDHRGLEEGVVGICRGALAGAIEDGAIAPREDEREVADDVTLALVGLGHGKDLVGLGGGHVLVEVRPVPVDERAAAPIGQQLLEVAALGVLGDLELVLGAGGELVELVGNPVGAHLGRDDARARRGAAVSHEQVMVIDDDLVLGEHVCDGAGTAHDDGLALGGAPALGIEQCALEVDDARDVEDGVLDGLGAGREHRASP